MTEAPYTPDVPGYLDRFGGAPYPTRRCAPVDHVFRRPVESKETRCAVCGLTWWEFLRGTS